MDTAMKNRILGGLWGAIVGDALGVPVEFTSREERQRDPVTDMRGYQYLGDPTLWWVICDVNDLAFPLDLPVGATLRIPSLERVLLCMLD